MFSSERGSLIPAWPPQCIGHGPYPMNSRNLSRLTWSEARESGRAARILPLEIAYGRFQRRIGLPLQALTLANQRMQDGCLTLTFSRKESS